MMRYLWNATVRGVMLRIWPVSFIVFPSASNCTISRSRAVSSDFFAPARRLRELSAAEYGTAFMAVLARRATRRTHAHALQHALGCLKPVLDGAERAELLEAIEQYRAGLLPLIVPITLLKHHLRHHPHPHLAGQTYFNPDPPELALRYGD